ncbi:unnamed protein product [Lymnaea stagnalis]|uniref:UDP-glucuronosyltransferase n=1 Tax=Lymnaea stagnalis TaxID=6523 RepID=A0AAV2IAE5_LYMST
MATDKPRSFHAKVCVMMAATVLLLSACSSEAKRVVLFSVPHVANVRTHTNVGRALTALGHEAYVCIPQFMLDEKMVNVDGVSVVPYGDYLGNVEELFFGKSIEKIWNRESVGVSHMINFFQAMKEMVRKILGDEALESRLRSLEPDLFVITNFPPFKNFVILPYKLDVPFVYMSPFNDLPSQRVPFSPSATACPISASFSNEGMTLVDRLKTAVCNVMILIMDQLVLDDSMVSEFAPQRPQISVEAIQMKAELYIVESDHVLDFAKPELPSMKLIGCTAPIPAKPLKEPFKSFVDSAPRGVAVVTFGSSVVNLPPDVSDKMASAFLQQDLHVVWRVNLSSPDPVKILTSKWVPQNDILGHPNTKLFISHCGANGQYESVYHGVPMLCLPLVGDQFYNAQRSKSKGFGLTGSIMDLTDKELADLMRKITQNETFRSNVKKASELFRLLYKVPAESAALWIDHVMEYGGTYMRSAGQLMPMYQFLMLDVLGVVSLSCLLALLVVFGLLRCCFRLGRKICGRKQSSRKSKKD